MLDRSERDENYAQERKARDFRPVSMARTRSVLDRSARTHIPCGLLEMSAVAILEILIPCGDAEGKDLFSHLSKC